MKNKKIKPEIIPVQEFDFDDSKVRTVNKNGEIWFVANDVATILEIQDVRTSLRSLHTDDRHTMPVIDTLGRIQKTTVINESGLYDLVLQSRKPNAKIFRRWVTSEVLPSIRKKGYYSLEIENAENLSEDELRVEIRGQVSEHEKKFHKTLKDQIYDNSPSSYAIIHAKGYQGLYNLKTPYHATKQIAKIKGLPKDSKILDHMGSEELAINFFHITQTKSRLKQSQVSQKDAEQITFDIGQYIRKMVAVLPENLPAEENINNVKKRITEAKINSSLINTHEVSIKLSDLDKIKISTIDVSKDLWKVALILAFFKEDGIITTKELLEDLPKIIHFDEKYQKILPSTKKPSYIQVIKNLKSNKTNDSNWIKLGYVEDLPKTGYKITEIGTQFVKEQLLLLFKK